MNMPPLVKSVAAFANKNAPAIFTALGVGGVITTVVLAIKATPKAVKLIEAEKAKIDIEYEEEDGEIKHYPPEAIKLPKKTYFKILWKPYLPVAISGAVTIGFIIGANVISGKRLAALAGLYATSEKLLTTYQDQVIKQLGENTERRLREGIAKDNVENDPPKEGSIILTGEGSYLFKDLRSGQYFRSNIEIIRAKINDIREILNAGDTLSLNEVYNILDPHIESVQDGDMIGWEAYSKFDVTFDTTIAHVNMLNGTIIDQPCMTIMFNQNPRDRFDLYS